MVPKTIPKGVALKKTLYPCGAHELYFVSHEALTEHFMAEHWEPLEGAGDGEAFLKRG